jgi:hypothetical protein
MVACCALMVAGGLTSCSSGSDSGGDAPSETCQAVADIVSIVDQIESTVRTKSDIPALKTQLSQISSDLDYLKAHPQDAYSSELAAAEQAAVPLKADLQAVQANPSSANYKAARSSASAFKDALDALTTAANTTC